MAVAVGKKVSDFVAVSTAGEVRPSAFAGGRLVLYFYPKDNTPGCTQQGADFRDRYPEFRAANCEIVGVSRDSLRTHEGFRAKHEFPFHLISDPDETLCSAFAVMKLKNMYGKKVRGIERSTFVIDTDGRLLREWRGLKVPGHVDEVLAYVQSL